MLYSDAAGVGMSLQVSKFSAIFAFAFSFPGFASVDVRQFPDDSQARGEIVLVM